MHLHSHRYLLTPDTLLRFQGYVLLWDYLYYMRNLDTEYLSVMIVFMNNFISRSFLISMIKWIYFDKIIFVFSNFFCNLIALFIFWLKIHVSRLVEQSKVVSSFHVVSPRDRESISFAEESATIFLFSPDFSISKTHTLTPQSADESTTDKFKGTETTRRNTGIHWARLALHRNRTAALFICRSTAHFFFCRTWSDVFVSHLHRDWWRYIFRFEGAKA